MHSAVLTVFALLILLVPLLLDVRQRLLRGQSVFGSVFKVARSRVHFLSVDDRSRWLGERGRAVFELLLDETNSGDAFLEPAIVAGRRFDVSTALSHADGERTCRPSSTRESIQASIPIIRHPEDL